MFIVAPCATAAGSDNPPASTRLRAQQAHFATAKEQQPVTDASNGRVRIKRPAQPASLPPPATQSDPSVSGASNTFLERGKNFSRHGLYKEAADFFTHAADADPKNAQAYNLRARAEWQLGMNKEALEDADWAIKLNPDCAEAFCTRAAIHNSLSQYQDAVADTSMAQDLNPNLRDAYMLQAVAYRNLGQHREADEVIAKLNNVAAPQSAFDEAQPNLDYTPYLTYLQQAVRQSWNAPQGAYGSAVALFKIHRDGKITDLRLNNTTGDRNADSAALNAVRSCVPFREPPAGTPPDFDVYIVLEPAARAPGPDSSQAAAPTAQSPGVGQYNALNGALYQGLGIMRRYIPVW